MANKSFAATLAHGIASLPTRETCKWTTSKGHIGRMLIQVQPIYRIVTEVAVTGRSIVTVFGVPDEQDGRDL